MTAKSTVHGKWNVLPDLGKIHMKSSRVGLITISAIAPIVGGFADWLPHKADMSLDIDLHNITTGNRMLDGQVRKVILSGSDGILRFKGAGVASDDELQFDGDAVCGNIVVPMSLTGESQGLSDEGILDIVLGGLASFEDLKLPIPGFRHIDKIDLHIDGDIKLGKK